MAEVLSGSGNFSYINNTEQNVRVIINFFSGNTSDIVTLSWGGVSITLPESVNLAFGRNLAFFSYRYGLNGGTIVGNNMCATYNGTNNAFGFAPTEIILSGGQTFSMTAQERSIPAVDAIAAYNIVVIPEAG